MKIWAWLWFAMVWGSVVWYAVFLVVIGIRGIADMRALLRGIEDDAVSRERS